VTISARFVFLCWMCAGAILWLIAAGCVAFGVTSALGLGIQSVSEWHEPLALDLARAGTGIGVWLTARRARKVPGCERTRPAVIVFAAITGSVLGVLLDDPFRSWLRQAGETGTELFLEDAEILLPVAGYGLGVLAGTMFLAPTGETVDASSRT